MEPLILYLIGSVLTTFFYCLRLKLNSNGAWKRFIVRHRGFVKSMLIWSVIGVFAAWPLVCLFVILPKPK